MGLPAGRDPSSQQLSWTLIFRRPLSGVPASILSYLSHLCSPPQSILSVCLEFFPAPEPQPLCRLFQKAFLNHLSPQWDTVFLSSHPLRYGIFICHSIWTIIIYFSIVHTALYVSISWLWQIASFLKSCATFRSYSYKKTNGVERVLSTCWVRWTEFARSCASPRGCWMYIYQAELIITVYRRLFSIDAENTENLYYTNPDMGFAGSLDLTVGHDT